MRARHGSAAPRLGGATRPSGTIRSTPSLPSGAPEKPLGQGPGPSRDLGRRGHGSGGTSCPSLHRPDAAPYCRSPRLPTRGPSAFYCCSSAPPPVIPASFRSQVSIPWGADVGKPRCGPDPSAGGTGQESQAAPPGQGLGKEGDSVPLSPRSRAGSGKPQGPCSPLRPTRNPTGQGGGSGCLG